MEAGRPIEIEPLIGAVVELGKITETPTPHIEAVYALTSLLSPVFCVIDGRRIRLRG